MAKDVTKMLEEKFGPDVGDQMKNLNRVGSAILGISKEYIASCSPEQLETHAREEEKIFYDGKEALGDICKNAYSQYSSVFEDLSDPLVVAMSEMLSSRDGLGDLSVGCRLTGKKCMALMGKGREEPRNVKMLIPKELVSDWGIKREVSKINKRSVGDCPGYNVDRELYDSAMRGRKE